MKYLICTLISLNWCFCSSWAQQMEKLNDHEYVDLGLSVLWASKNIGASHGEDLGDYFAWGEIDPKMVYSKKNYKFGEWNNLYKYVNKQANRYDFEYGLVVDSLTELEVIDDVAACAWGSPWRMPTNKEYKELVTECEWIWIPKYKGKDVNGYMVRGKNGNEIFLPCGGEMKNDTKMGINQIGSYWTSTLQKNRFAYEMAFDVATIDIDLNWNFRYVGRSVRPVVDRMCVVPLKTQLNSVVEYCLMQDDLDSLLSYFNHDEEKVIMSLCSYEMNSQLNVDAFWFAFSNRESGDLYTFTYKSDTLYSRDYGKFMSFRGESLQLKSVYF